MLRIRLSRVGRKHDPSYRMIVTEKGRGPQTGNYVEQVGTYDARSDKHVLKGERISYWLSVGAQPSDTVHNLLVKTGILDAPTVNPLPKKTPIVSESEEETESEAETSDDGETEESASADSPSPEAADEQGATADEGEEAEAEPSKDVEAEEADETLDDDESKEEESAENGDEEDEV
ncbi:MAG: 30S ribosomal protein S16 [Candidatus Paceibacterota bacterium]